MIAHGASRPFSSSEPRLINSAWLGALGAELDATSWAADLAVVLGAVTTGASRGMRTVMSNGLAG
jgi:hypothetical protein